MNKINYQRQLETVIEGIKAEGKTPRLLLHACCAPCSSHCLDYLSEYFDITVFYYNPNIYPEREYRKRVSEIKRFLGEIPLKNKVRLLEGEYEPRCFFGAVKGLEDIKEGGERCFACFRLRLKEAAKAAAEGGFDFFTTTLTISPLKNAAKLNEIGFEEGEKAGVSWLPSDFKKKNGYKHSIELSAKYNLYRQDYCGCVFSQRERQLQKENKEKEASQV
ncbi:MAG: epoxyqueuosine reductase QueH [Clostridiales bacterium]|nr:epoxyqueuosine reductase QueH [Clostridiales bacterium]